MYAIHTTGKYAAPPTIGETLKEPRQRDMKRIISQQTKYASILPIPIYLFVLLVLRFFIFRHDTQRAQRHILQAVAQV